MKRSDFFVAVTVVYVYSEMITDQVYVLKFFRLKLFIISSFLLECIKENYIS